MKIETFDVEIEGVTPLIIHNCRTGNPLDVYAKKLKALTSKRLKTEEDHEAILKVQWEACLYWNETLKLYIPWENLYAMLLHAAKKHKLGPKMGAVTFTDPIGYSLIVPHHEDLEALRADQDNKFIKLVTIQRSKTLSCRPMFDDWSLKFSFEFESDVVDPNEMKTILITASRRGGLGVWRPSSPKPGPYGTFTVKSLIYKNSKGKKINLGD